VAALWGALGGGGGNSMKLRKRWQQCYGVGGTIGGLWSSAAPWVTISRAVRHLAGLWSTLEKVAATWEGDSGGEEG